MTISLEVLAERLEALCSRVDAGFEDLKKMTTQTQIRFDGHLEADEGKHKTLERQLEDLKIEVAVFKARWSILAVVGSAIVSGLISLLVSRLMKGL